ncbi:MAG TPA: hypothetical protein VNN08_02765 [Thermoanaerobaculia bacterium]|nr:hypothetical protein [Thermoanaerobaculia bacterium]
MKRLTSALLLLIAAIVTAHAADRDPELVRAESLLAAKKYQEAITAADAYRVRHPADRTVYRLLAEAHARRDEWGKTFDDIQAMSKTGSDRAASIRDAGNALYDVVVRTNSLPDDRRAATLELADHYFQIVNRDYGRDAEALKYHALILEERARLATSPVTKELIQSELKTARAMLVEANETLHLKANETWGVGLIQDETVEHPSDPDGAVVLRRAPFTIRVMSTSNSPVEINGADSDVNFKRVRAGYRVLEDCAGKERIPFCPGSNYGESPGNPNKRLNVNPDGAHYVDAPSPSASRWSKMSRSGILYVLDRDVAQLGDTPIEKTASPRLYLTILQRRYDDGVLKEDEIRRIAIRFR